MNNEIQEIRYQVGEAWKGTYNAATTYGNANVVQDPTGLSVYRSLKPGNVGHPLTDTAWWFLIIDLSSIKEESDRIKALNDAIAADEAQRVENENGRVTAEQGRVYAETARVTAEQGRVSAEQQRVSAEQQRASQEQTRISQEQSRVTAEQGRVAAEAQRVQKEQLRENNEEQRVINETNRVAAEAERVEQYTADHQQAVADHEQYVDFLGVFDLSKHNAVGGVLATYADMSAALTALNALDSKYKYGGMSFKFVQSSDNKYVQYRLMKNQWSITVSDWQGVDNTPTVSSDNLVKSGGVAEAIGKLPSVIESETDFSIEDKNGNAIVEFDDGHIRTKKFDSKIVQEDIVNAKEQIEDLETKITPVVDNSAKGLLFSDEEGNVVGGWKDGHEVSKYPSAYTTDAYGVLNIEDSKGNKILSLNDGHIKTKNFSSKDLVNKVNDLIENGVKKKISILFVGNSMTQDAISYLPYVLKEIAPDVNFKFYIYFTGGFTLADQYNNFIHEFIPGTFSVCENNIRWTNNTSWESTIHKSMKEWLKVIDFDILCLQDYFSTQPNDDNAVTDFNNCVNYIRDNYDGQFKVVTLFHRPRTNVFDPNGPQSTLDCFNITKGAVEKCMKQTACQSVIACGVAAYFATLDPILQPLGDIGNLTPDGSHAQDTMACVMQSFTAALWIFSELGLPYGVYNNNIRIDQTLFNAINPPGPNVGSGIIVGTDAENNEAQLVAVKAFKYGQNLVNNSLV